MPRFLDRLWRSGARHAEPAEAPATRPGGQEMGRRLEAARERLRQTIPPPEEISDGGGERAQASRD